ncbi:MAG: ABC transporter permease [Acidobacteria bacterium]|nr:ABC transporter permease [Acidobacteriota bacterium]
MRVLLRVIVKELLQLRRDRRMIPIVLGAPIIQLIAFGYAANTDVTDIRTLLVDLDRTAESRELVDSFAGSGYFDFVGSEENVSRIDPWLVEGRAAIALVIGSGYGAAVASGRTPRLQLIADGSDSSSAIVGLGHAVGIIASKNGDLVRTYLQRITQKAGAGAGIDLVPRVWYNADLRSRWFYVPAVLAMILMVVTMILSSMGVVREKELGTMEQLIVTPIRPWQLIVGKLFPFAAIGLLDLHLVTALTVWFFGVPLRGSFPLLVGLTMLFLLTTLGLGLLVSTVVRTQQQAMLASVFFLMIPMIYLSGLIFPIENMPRAIQYVTYLIPLRYYARIIRAIFLRGAGIETLWPEAVILALVGIGVIAIASLRFRKRLD